MDEFGLKKMKEQLEAQLDKLDAKYKEGLLTTINYNKEVARVEQLIDELKTQI